MNLRQLRYFSAVADELHFGRAAEKLHISQPPLSVSIQQLEKNLGVTLFDRSNKNVALTNAGKMLYQEAQVILKQVQNMTNLASRLAQGFRGQINVGFIESMLFRGLPEILHTFQSEYPDIDLILREMNTAKQIEGIQRGYIDIGFINTGDHALETTSRLLQKEPFICCLPKNHRYRDKILISLQSLSEENFILFPRDTSPYYYDRVIRLCEKSGFLPKVRHEVRNWLTIISFVNQNMGVAIIPKSMTKATLQDVIYIPLEENTILSEIFCIWHEQSNSSLLTTFKEFIPFPETI